jgi:hypothetical protein
MFAFLSQFTENPDCSNFCKLSAQRFFYVCNIWPKNQYGENLNCQWLITSADGLAIEVDFGSPFHLEVPLHKPDFKGTVSGDEFGF